MLFSLRHFTPLSPLLCRLSLCLVGWLFVAATLSAEEADLPKKIDDLLFRLDDERYQVREEASKALVALGKEALPLLNNKGTLSPEVAWRVQLVRQAIEQGLPPEQYRGQAKAEGLDKLPEPARVVRLCQELSSGEKSATTAALAEIKKITLPENRLLLARQLLRIKDPALHRELLGVLNEKDGAEGLLLRVRIHQEFGKPLDAIPELEAFPQLSGNALVAQTLFSLYLETGKLDKARALRSQGNLFQNQPWLDCQLFRTLLEKKELEPATALLQTTVERPDLDQGLLSTWLEATLEQNKPEMTALLIERRKKIGGAQSSWPRFEDSWYFEFRLALRQEDEATTTRMLTETLPRLGPLSRRAEAADRAAFYLTLSGAGEKQFAALEKSVPEQRKAFQEAIDAVRAALEKKCGTQTDTTPAAVLLAGYQHLGNAPELTTAACVTTQLETLLLLKSRLALHLGKATEAQSLAKEIIALSPGETSAVQAWIATLPPILDAKSDAIEGLQTALVNQGTEIRRLALVRLLETNIAIPENPLLSFAQENPRAPGHLPLLIAAQTHPESAAARALLSTWNTWANNVAPAESQKLKNLVEGISLLLRQDPPHAVETLRRAAIENPAHTPTLFYLATALIASQEESALEEAAFIARGMQLDAPHQQSALAAMLLAEVAWKKGNQEEARQKFLEAAALQASSSQKLPLQAYGLGFIRERLRLLEAGTPWSPPMPRLETSLRFWF